MTSLIQRFKELLGFKVCVLCRRLLLLFKKLPSSIGIAKSDYRERRLYHSKALADVLCSYTKRRIKIKFKQANRRNMSLLNQKMSTMKHENIKFRNLIEKINLIIKLQSKLKADTIGIINVKYTH